MAFNNYLEDENDKPYFKMNSLAYYYDKMEGFAKAVEGSAKALNLTKEEIEQRIALRLAEWDGKLEGFDSSVETLLTEWVDDGTLTPLIDSTLIDQKIAPVAAQLSETALKTEVEATNKRLDEKIIDSGAANAEVSDAHVSLVKNKAFGTIGNRIEEIEKDTVVPVANLVKNGNFTKDVNADGVADEWVKGSSVSNSSIVGNKQVWTPLNDGSSGAMRSPSLTSFNVQGNNYYLSFKQKNIRALMVASDGSASDIVTPTEDGAVSTIFNSSLGNLESHLRFYGRLANVVAELESVVLVNLTATFGAGKEPSLAKIDEFLGQHTNRWFDGTVSFYTIKNVADHETRLLNIEDNQLSKEYVDDVTLGVITNGFKNLAPVVDSDLQLVTVENTVSSIVDTPSWLDSSEEYAIKVSVGTAQNYGYSWFDIPISNPIEKISFSANVALSPSSQMRTLYPDMMIYFYNDGTSLGNKRVLKNTALSETYRRYSAENIDVPAGANIIRLGVRVAVNQVNTAEYFVNDINLLARPLMPDAYIPKETKKEANESTVLSNTYNFSMYESLGVIGDSYASGSFGDNPGDEVAPEHYSVSWPQMLGRRNGLEVANYTKGGLATRTWLTDSKGLSALKADTPKQLYILALIRNDYNIENRGETGYKGTEADIVSKTDTFYGNYARIIDEIKSHAPNSHIIIMTGDYQASNVLGTGYNEAVKNIAVHFDLPCMVQLEHPYFSSTNYRDDRPDGGHPGITQYNGMATAIEDMFSKTVNDNLEYFMYF